MTLTHPVTLTKIEGKMATSMKTWPRGEATMVTTVVIRIRAILAWWMQMARMNILMARAMAQEVVAMIAPTSTTPRIPSPIRVIARTRFASQAKGSHAAEAHEKPGVCER